MGLFVKIKARYIHKLLYVNDMQKLFGYINISQVFLLAKLWLDEYRHY